MSELLSYKGIGDLLGKRPDTIYRYLKNNTLPKPTHYIDNKPVWEKKVIEDWHKQHNQLEKEEN